jgi:hypothetical protein
VVPSRAGFDRRYREGSADLLFKVRGFWRHLEEQNIMPNEENADAVGQSVEKTGEAAGQPGNAQDQSAEPAKKRGGRRKKEGDAKGRTLGPVTDQSGNRKSKLRGKGRYSIFTHLPHGMRTEGERLLENGATFEEATEWINEHHAPEKPDGPQGVTLAAVTDYFRSSFEMQRRRIRRMQEMAQELKKALTGKADSAKAELADAVFFTGVMGLSRGTASFSVKDAQRDYVAREALRLREQQIAAQLETERCKQEKLRIEMGGLKQTLESEAGHLSAEALRKIREIYGLIDQSVIASGAQGGQREEANV